MAERRWEKCLWGTATDRSTSLSLHGGCRLVSAGCSATTVQTALRELVLLVRNLLTEPRLVLKRASHASTSMQYQTQAMLENACQLSPCSKCFVPHTFLHGGAFPSLMGSTGLSLRETVYQKPWDSLEESQKNPDFCSSKMGLSNKSLAVDLPPRKCKSSCKCICNVTPCSPVFFFLYTLLSCHRSLQSRKEAGVDLQVPSWCNGYKPGQQDLPI